MEFHTGDRVRPRNPSSPWRNEKIIIDSVCESGGKILLDLKVCFKTGGCFLARGMQAEFFEHWKTPGKRRNFRQRREKWRRKTAIKTEIA